MASRSALLFVAGVTASLLGCGNRSDGTPPPECQTAADCPADKPLCFNDVCVACAKDNDCDCHRICERGVCQPLGASADRDALHAHGVWEGSPEDPNAPGEANPKYHFAGTCTIESEDTSCSFGQRCNPLTSGCVNAVDFDTHCTLGDDTCAAGAACADTSDGPRCLPVALCRGPTNCCGGTEFVCDAAPGSIGACIPNQNECTPPSPATSSCPFLPKERGGDCNGELCCNPGTFCSHFGACVECVCDLDCNPGGADNGLKCYQPEHRCRGRAYCVDSSECNANESCDTPNNRCQAFCDASNEAAVCTSVQFCELRYNVCRPLSEMPCEADAWEPNDTAEQAVTNGFALPPPPMDGTETLEGFSVCPGDSDWFTIALDAGDHLVVSGRAIGALEGSLSAVAPDGVTHIGAGAFGSYPSLLELTANSADTYYLNIAPTLGTKGFYSLTLSRSQGVACVDAFEATEGNNDKPADATALYDTTNPGAPAECAYTSAAGGLRSIECDGVMALCNGDVDYYLANVPNGGDIDIRVDGFAGNVDIALYGPFQQAREANNAQLVALTSGDATVETLFATARPAGYFLIHVMQSAGAATAYDLLVQVDEGNAPCTEDPYDDPSVPGSGAPSTPTLVIDPSGTNDDIANATALALVLDTDVWFDSTPLSLCRADVDWFEVGMDNAGQVIPLSAGRRIELEVELDAASPPGRITLAAGPGEQTLPYGSVDPAAPLTQLVVPLTRAGERMFVRVGGSPNNDDDLAYRMRAKWIEPATCDVDALGDPTGADNDAPTDATPLVPPDWPTAVGDEFEFAAIAPATLSLCPGGDDWYHISAPANAQVQVWTRHDPSVADIGLALYDANVTILTGADQPTAGQLPVQFEIDASEKAGSGFQQVRGKPPTGEAYIAVTNRTGWPLLDYRLGVRLLDSCGQDDFETNNTWDFATPVPLGRQLSSDGVAEEVGVISPATLCSASGGEHDLYSISLNPRDTIAARIYYDPLEGDLDASLHPPGIAWSNTTFASDTDQDGSGETGVLTIDYSLGDSDPSGMYLLRVKPGRNGIATGNFYYVEVTVQRFCSDDAFEPAPPNEVAMLPWQPGPTVLNQTLCFDEDWFQIDVPGGYGDVKVCSRYDSNAIDLLLEVWDNIDVSNTAIPAGSDLLPNGLSDNRGDWQEVLIDRSASTAANTYYIHTYPTYTPKPVPFVPPHPFHETYELWVLDTATTCPPP